MTKERGVASPKGPSRIIFLLTVLLLMSCGEYSLHSYHSVGGEWYKGNSFAFMQDSALHSGADSVDLYVGVRYSAAYKYKNLCMLVAISAGGGSVLFCDTVCCDIYDDAGYRNGSTAGALYQAEYYVASLPWNNIHTICLQHIMRDSILQGVYDVGVKLVPRGRHLYAGR